MSVIYSPETKGENADLKLAVLIDADNIPYSYIKGILSEIARYGTPSVKRIYGDWTRPDLGEIGNNILKKEPSFDARNYGYSKLTPLIAATELFEIDRRDTANRGIKHIYIRSKNFSKGEPD